MSFPPSTFEVEIKDHFLPPPPSSLALSPRGQKEREKKDNFYPEDEDGKCLYVGFGIWGLRRSGKHRGLL